MCGLVFTSSLVVSEFAQG